MLQQAEPRVEFRIFDTDLKNACRLLANAAQGVEGRVSTETYIVTRLTSEAIVKIRDRHLYTKYYLCAPQQLL
jgi:hypothetical protein